MSNIIPFGKYKDVRRGKVVFLADVERLANIAE
jgi:hypothetical protein